MEEQLPSGLWAKGRYPGSSRTTKSRRATGLPLAGTGRSPGDTPLARGAMFDLEQIGQVDGVVAAPSAALPDAGAHDGDGKMGLVAAGSVDRDEIALSLQEDAGDQFLDQGLIDREGSRFQTAMRNSPAPAVSVAVSTIIRARTA